jgi:hypothetical protein
MKIASMFELPGDRQLYILSLIVSLLNGNWGNPTVS